MGQPKRDSDSYSEQETQRRTEAALRAAFGAPHKPQSEMKLGKPRGKVKKSPSKSTRKKSG
jgi:hypothetical protein